MLPDAPIVHPRIGGYPCADLCAAAVAHKLAQALLAASGEDPRMADEDLDLVALATVADVVPLLGENRRLVRAGLRALASTRKPGLRALMDVARVDPSTIDAGAIGFRLGPRLNAAGRLYRADAGLELLLTEDRERARAVALELDANNTERRDVETRIRFEAEAQVAEQGAAAAYVLASDGWHAGVIGIVAARIAERHHRPCVLIALDGEEGTGSGRSIPGFDLLGGLHAASETLQRYGGHRAAAGLTIARADVPAFREAFAAHAASVLAPEDLRPEIRVDAVAPGDALTLTLAEELEQLAPFGQGNPAVSLLVPAALLDDPRPMGEGRHVAFTLAAGGARSRCVLFGAGTRLPAEPDEPVQARRPARAQPLERHHRATADPPPRPPGHPAADRRASASRASWTGPAVGELDRDLDARASTARDRRGDARASLRPCRGTRHRRPARRPGRDGRASARGDRPRAAPGAACSATASGASRSAPGRPSRTTRRWPAASPTSSPSTRRRTAALDHLSGAGWTHLAWGEPELRFAARIHQWDFALRDPLAAVYRALRAARHTGGEACEALLRGEGPQPRSAALAGRLVRVLAELDLVDFDREGPALRAVEAPERTALERSAAFRAYHRRLEDGLRFLSSSPIQAAA